MEQNKKKKKQKILPSSLRGYKLVLLIAKANKRTITAQIEVLAEEECKRQGIVIPAEIMED